MRMSGRIYPGIQLQPEIIYKFMTKTVQKNLSLIGGLFFLAQSTMAPVASAAGFLTEGQPIYWHAATSADPIMFNDHGCAINYPIVKVAENTEITANFDRVIDNSEPSIQDVKNYVLNEIKKAGLNTR